MSVNNSDELIVNRDGTTYTTTVEKMADLRDNDLLLVNRENVTYTVTGKDIKDSTGGNEPQILTSPTLTTDSQYPTATLTATEATFVNATRTPDTDYSPWFKDGTQIPGASGLTYTATTDGTYKYQERWVGNDGSLVFPKAEVVINKPSIQKPTILSPLDGAGEGDGSPTQAISDEIDSIAPVAGGWTRSYYGSGGQEWFDIAYGQDSNGIYKSVTASNAVAFRTADGGDNWNLSGSGVVAGDWRNICYYGGNPVKWIMLSRDDQEVGLYSPDAIQWSTFNITGRSFYSMSTDGQGTIIAPHTAGIMYSTNGTDWTASNAPNQQFYASAYGNGRFVALGGTGTYRSYFSTDGGVTWSNGDAPTASWECCGYGDGKFIALATNLQITSTDGQTWTSSTIGDYSGSVNWQSVKYYGGMWVAVAQQGQVIWSTDGENWTESLSGTQIPGQWRGLCYDEFSSKWIAVGSADVNKAITATNPTDGYSVMTLDSDNAFNSATGAAIGTINDVFKKGNSVSSTNSINPGNISILDLTVTDVGNTGEDYSVLTDGVYRTNNDNFVYDNPVDASIDYGSEVVIDYMEFAPQGSVGTEPNTYNQPDKIVIYSSTDGTSWSEVTTRTFDDYSWCAGEFTRVDLNSASSRFWRIRASRNNSFASLSEWRIGRSGGTSTDALVIHDYAGTGNIKDVPGVNNTTKSLIWVKMREPYSNQEHMLFDTLRGQKSYLRTDATIGVQNFNSPAFSSWDTDGYTMSNGFATLNNDNGTYVSWNFQAGPRFFDIVEFNSDTEGGSTTINHSLQQVPGCVFIKDTSSNQNEDWYVWHQACEGNEYLMLNRTANSKTMSGVDAADGWLGTETTFRIPGFLQASSRSYIAYLWGNTPGLIKCGSYDGSSTNKSIFTGFAPRYIMIKNKSLDSSESNWFVWDTQRGEGNALAYNTTSNEGNLSGNAISFSSTGWSMSGSRNEFNNSSNKYIYIAIANGAQVDGLVPTAEVLETPAAGSKDISLTKVLGDWTEGSKIRNDKTTTNSPPDPNSLEFVGSVPAASNGTISTWGDATWSVKDKATEVTQTETKAITAGQTQTLDVGNDITLAAGVEYEVTVKYDSPEAAAPATSDPNSFKTNYPYKWQSNTSWPAAYGGMLYSTSAQSRARQGDSIEYRIFLAGILGSGDTKRNRIIFQDPNEAGWSGTQLPVEVESDVLRVMVLQEAFDNLIGYPKGNYAISMNAKGGTSSTVTAHLLTGGPANQEIYSALYNPATSQIQVCTINGMIWASPSGLDSWIEDTNLFDFLVSKSVWKLTWYHQFSRFIACGGYSSSQGSIWIGTRSGDRTSGWRAANADFDMSSYEFRDIALPRDSQTNRLVAVGPQGIAYSGLDGDDWKLASGFDAGSTFQTVSKNVKGNVDVWVACNTGSTGRPIAVSTDGITWQSQDLPGGADTPWSVIGYNNKFSVAGTLSETGSQIYDVAASDVFIQDQTLYYDTNNLVGVTGQELLDRYGSLDNLAEMGIAELEEQPNYAQDGYFIPAGYELQANGKYKFIRDYASELAAARALIENFNNP